MHPRSSNHNGESLVLLLVPERRISPWAFAPQTITTAFHDKPAGRAGFFSFSTGGLAEELVLNLGLPIEEGFAVENLHARLGSHAHQFGLQRVVDGFD